MAPASIDAPAAWMQDIPEEGVRVAVIDGGFQFSPSRLRLIMDIAQL